MKTRILVMVSAVALIAGLAVLAGCKKKEEAPAPPPAEPNTAMSMEMEVEQTTCPVMDGNKIDKNVFVEYKGKKVYFCCPDCKAKFEADPEKYIAKLPQFQQ
jgi:YHS domain-containing protein